MQAVSLRMKSPLDYPCWQTQCALLHTSGTIQRIGERVLLQVYGCRGMAGHGPRDVVPYNSGEGKCAVQVSHYHLPTARCASIPEISKHI